MKTDELLAILESEEVEIKMYEGYNEAIIGLSDSNKLIYDFDLMVEVLMKRDGMSREDAVEFLDYNIMGFNLGEDAPVILYEKVEGKEDIFQELANDLQKQVKEMLE